MNVDNTSYQGPSDIIDSARQDFRHKIKVDKNAATRDRTGDL